MIDYEIKGKANLITQSLSSVYVVKFPTQFFTRLMSKTKQISVFDKKHTMIQKTFVFLMRKFACLSKHKVISFDNTSDLIVEK